MLGHKLAQTLRSAHETYATIRQEILPQSLKQPLDEVNVITGVPATDFSAVKSTIERVKPSVVINCVGIVKQLAEAEDHIASISVNSLLPHQLAELCNQRNARFITLGTDCVFSGSVGNYSDSDKPDPVDLYGRTKLLGEVARGNSLTIRTSMIGRQLIGNHGLVEWLLTRGEASVKGYRRAIFSGFTTNELSEIIAQIIDNHPDLKGIWQVAAEPISKFDLLNVIKDVYELPVQIIPDDLVVCDRSLNGVKFRQATGIAPRSWTDMIGRMKSDLTSYPLPTLLKC